MEATQKTCVQCLETLPITSFYKHHNMTSGRLNKCVECVKKNVVKNKLKNPEHYKTYHKEWRLKEKAIRKAMNPVDLSLPKIPYMQTEPGKQARKKAVDKYHSKHPDRMKARTIVGNAMRNGSIEKSACFTCGNEKVEAHHPDYSRPLDVIWLCTLHHKQAHILSDSFYLDAADKLAA